MRHQVSIPLSGLSNVDHWDSMYAPIYRQYPVSTNVLATNEAYMVVTAKPERNTYFEVLLAVRGLELRIPFDKSSDIFLIADATSQTLTIHQELAGEYLLGWSLGDIITCSESKI